MLPISNIALSIKLLCTKMSILQKKKYEIFAVIHPFQQVTLVGDGAWVSASALSTDTGYFSSIMTILCGVACLDFFT